jgi:hypothetical protein
MSQGPENRTPLPPPIEGPEEQEEWETGVQRARELLEQGDDLQIAAFLMDEDPETLRRLAGDPEAVKAIDELKKLETDYPGTTETALQSIEDEQAKE